MSETRVTHVTQADRAVILQAPGARAYRKTARIVAIRMRAPFTVDTDRGLMEGRPGDFLVTNHPDDDPGSDIWTISRERMLQTYDEVGLAGPVQQQPQKRTYSIEQAARRHAINPVTIKKALKRGELKARRDTLHAGHPFLFDEAELDRWVEFRQA